MVATASLERELAARGFRNLMRWPRGVDHQLFRPRPEEPPFDLPRPIFLYVGRVAVEKNIGDFLRLDLPGSKVVVGGGPALASLRVAHPAAHFLGPLAGESLARAYAKADVFVFPSRTDTFGLVLLEAIACGLPVAGYPVPGPKDVIGASGAGVLSDNLQKAALGALEMGRVDPDVRLKGFSWEACADIFESVLTTIGSATVPAPHKVKSGKIVSAR